MAEIARIDEGDHGEYRLEVEGSDRPAVLTWHVRGDARVASHTFTPPAARGKGVAARLVEAMAARLAVSQLRECRFIQLSGD